MENYTSILASLQPYDCQLIAVSKTKPVEAIQALYDAGQRHFGENKVQEMVDKQAALPKDIQWHMIGHLQRNKVKYIAPFVALIHAVDSEKLLVEIDKQAEKCERTIPVLLQLHIAKESHKFGFTAEEMETLATKKDDFKHISFQGVMGMATFTENESIIEAEFRSLRQTFEKLKTNYFGNTFTECSMGMSGDYKIALREGSTMVRIGSLLFGAR